MFVDDATNKEALDIDTARTLADELTALGVPARVSTFQGVIDNKVANIPFVLASVQNSMGSGATRRFYERFDAAAVAKAMLDDIKGSAKRTRTAIRRERSAT